MLLCYVEFYDDDDDYYIIIILIFIFVWFCFIEQTTVSFSTKKQCCTYRLYIAYDLSRKM